MLPSILTCEQSVNFSDNEIVWVTVSSERLYSVKIIESSRTLIDEIRIHGLSSWIIGLVISTGGLSNMNGIELVIFANDSEWSEL